MPTPEEIAELIKPPQAEPTPSEIAGVVTESATEPAKEDEKPPESAGNGQEPEKKEPEEEQPDGPRYQTQLQALMAKARAAREEQVSKIDPDAELLQKIKIAKDLGPDAVLRAAGLEREKIDISKLLGKEDDDPNKEIKDKISQLDNYINELREQQESAKQQEQQHKMQQAEQQELAGISQFIEKSKEKFSYVGAAKEIGSDKDIYNGLVSLYNQGYSPSYEEMADLVESRIEQLIDLVAPTKKFTDYIGKKFGVQLSRKNADSVTLTEGMKGESPETVDLEKMTDEENLQYALKAAYAAKEAELKRLKE